MQRHLAVGEIDGLAATPGLGLERPAGRDERRDVGDRVMHPEATAALLDEQRLVEIAGCRRINGDERRCGVVGPSAQGVGYAGNGCISLPQGRERVVLW